MTLPPAREVPRPRDFTAADKAFIRQVHAYMSLPQLLGVLNTRLASDLGEGCVLYSIEQLRAEIGTVATAAPNTGNDWGSLRKLLSKARREGVLERIDEQCIDDFAVVFSLNERQVMHLKDIVLDQGEDE